MTELVPRSKLRRCPHYVKLAANTAALALERAALPEEADRSRIGTVLATACGPQESNLSFARTALQEGTRACSPATFSFTVPNSCAGQVNMINGLKGASTFLMGNNPLEYAAVLLALGKADYLLCGAVDEVTPELEQAMRSRGQLEGVRLTEGAAMLVLEPQPSRGQQVAVTALQTAALTVSPYLGECSQTEVAVVEETLQALQREGLQPEKIYNAANGSGFGALEAEAIARVFGGNIPQYSPLLTNGDCLGAGWLAALVHAAEEMQAEGLGCVVVTGIDIKGNYVAAGLQI